MDDLDPLSFRRSLRRNASDAERLLWYLLRREFPTARWRRQHGFGHYVLDFFSSALRLAVEADGGQHFTDEGLAYDARRDAYLLARGITVLRFTDREILLAPGRVMEAIAHRMDRATAHP